MSESEPEYKPFDQTGEKDVGSSVILKRVNEFDEALIKAKTAADEQCDDSSGRVDLWTGVSFFSIVLALLVCRKFYNDSRVDVADVWRVGYYSIVRLGVIIVLITLGSFCFNMVKSFSHIHQRNRFSRTFIYSLASFVESWIDPVDKKAIFNKILAELLKGDKTGLLSKEDDLKSSDVMSTLKLIKDKISKNE